MKMKIDEERDRKIDALNQYAFLCRMLMDYSYEKATVKSMLEMLSGFQIEVGKDSIEKLKNKISKYESMEADLKEKTGRIASAIDSIPDYRYRSVLMERYIHGRTWEDVADLINVKKSRCYEIHDIAVDRLKI